MSARFRLVGELIAASLLITGAACACLLLLVAPFALIGGSDAPSEACADQQYPSVECVQQAINDLRSQIDALDSEVTP